MRRKTPPFILASLLTILPLYSAGHLDPIDSRLGEVFDATMGIFTPTLVPTGVMPRQAALNRVVENTDQLLRSEGRPVRRERLDEIARIAERAGLKYHLPPSLILAVIHTESRFRRTAVSPAGAIGLMQVQLATAQHFASLAGLAPPTAAGLLDPETNIELGTGYLRHLIDRFGNQGTALAAYNLGPGEVGRRLTGGQPFSGRYGREIRVREVYYTRSLSPEPLASEPAAG